MSEDIKVYTLEEVATILKMTRRTIYSYARKGVLPATKAGGRWRVTEDQLKDFLSGTGNKEA